MSLKLKLLIISLVLLLTVISQIFYNNHKTNNMIYEINKNVKYTDLLDNSNDLTRLINEFHIHFDHFYGNTEEKNEPYLLSLRDKIKSEIDQILKLNIPESNSGYIEVIIKNVDIIYNNIDNMKLLMEKRTEVIKRLDEIGPPYRRYIQENRNIHSLLNEIEDDFMLGRVRGMRYRSSNSINDLVGFNSIMNQTLSKIETLSENEIISNIKQRLNEYKDLYNNYSELKNNIDNINNNVELLIDEIENAQTELLSAIEKTIDDNNSDTLLKINDDKQIFILISILFSLTILISGYVLFRTLAKPIKNITKNMNDILDNKSVNISSYQFNDLIGDLYKTADKISNVSLSSFSKNEILDQLNTNVMAISANTFKVEYTNKGMKNLFNKLQKHLPQYDLSDCMGKDIGMFHTEQATARIKSTLSDIKNLPFNTIINVGDEVVQISAYPIIKNDVLTQFLIVWTLKTSEKQLVNNFEKSVGSNTNIIYDNTLNVIKNVENINENNKVMLNVRKESIEKVQYTEGLMSSVSASIEEMSSSINEISKQISNTLSIITTTKQKSIDVNIVLNDLINSLSKINDVIKSIDDIANKTNLLSLNATIEAARAGEHGKGFSVVASEVKELSKKTQLATSEITTVLNNVIEKINDTFQKSNDAVNAFDTLENYSNSVAASVEEQNAATSEINNNVESTYDSLKDISENFKILDTKGNDTSEIINNLNQSTGLLNENIEKLKNNVNNFLDTISK